MDIIFTYQYELLYSFGAFFALFSMLSYVSPTVHAAIARGETSMDSSDHFFSGFEDPDLTAIMSNDFEDEEEEKEERLRMVSEADEKDNVLSMSQKTGGFSED